MATIVVHPEKHQINALKVHFEEKKGDVLPGNVINGLKESQKDFAEGSFKKYTGIDDLFAR